MATERPTIDQWKARILQSPEGALERFLSRLSLVAYETERSMFTSIPDERILLENFKVSLLNEEAPLRGTPYLLQDLFDVEGQTTLCGAPFKDPFESPADQSCLLYTELEKMGAAFIGKTVPAEFGIDIQGRNKTYGDCTHASGDHKLAGGGAGAAVRAVHDGWVPIAFGLDSLGGMRVPTAFHGLFGYRMSANNYAREGVFQIVPSIESLGWVNHNLNDMLTTFLAFHPETQDSDLELGRGFVLFENSDLSSRVTKANVLTMCRELDTDDDPQESAPLIEMMRAGGQTLNTLMARELYYVHRYWMEEYHDDYAPEILHILEAGSDCRPAEAETCDQNREQICTTFVDFFDRYDYLILPVCPQPSPLRRKWSPQLERETRRCIAPASLANLPALTLPVRNGPSSYAAAQFIINPKKPAIVPALIKALQPHYENYTLD